MDTDRHANGLQTDMQTDICTKRILVLHFAVKNVVIFSILGRIRIRFSGNASEDPEPYQNERISNIGKYYLTLS